MTEPKRSYYIDEALRLFEAADYFMAHEVLEEHWAEAPEQDRDFLQGLIQLSVGLHHFSRGNLVGTRIQFRKASKRLKDYPTIYQGVDVDQAKQFLESALEMIDTGEDLDPPKLDAAT